MNDCKEWVDEILGSVVEEDYQRRYIAACEVGLACELLQLHNVTTKILPSGGVEGYKGKLKVVPWEGGEFKPGLQSACEVLGKYGVEVKEKFWRRRVYQVGRVHTESILDLCKYLNPSRVREIEDLSNTIKRRNTRTASLTQELSDMVGTLENYPDDF